MSATTTEKAKIDASQQDLTPPAFGAGEDHYKQWPNEAGVWYYLEIIAQALH